MARSDPSPPKAGVSPLLIAAVAIGVLAAMDGVMKQVVATTNPLTATFGRSLLGILIAVPLWVLVGRPRLQPGAMGAHLIRGFVMTLAACAFFWALTVLPLAEAVTLSFVSPLLIPFIAWALLGERPRATSLIAGVIGFTGVLLTTQGASPDADTPQRTLGIVAMLVAAVTWASALVLLRGRASQDGPAIITLMGAAVPAALLAPVALVVGEVPSLEATAWLLLGAALTVGGVWMLTQAYSRAEAQVLAPIEFTALGWAALIGWAFFDELPRTEVWAGAAIIIGACLFAAWDERRSKR
ncbi:DMT family transporter [Sphingoaurantiacus capsulatus]|uniref:DMT family transporter n=1 Tax=Sphingoaurantiacus capsulatus TaxID=1771310 RepID=A0ABV7X6X4_9SPHN